MALGLGLLRLPPETFWAMTLPELTAAVAGLVGTDRPTEPPKRGDIEALMTRFPDMGPGDG